MNIGDIAEMAGVSRAAVSRYLNGGYISAEKKERIRRIIEETGYTPSVMARTLRTKKTRLIGVVVPRIHSDAISSVVTGIGKGLGEASYEMLLGVTDNLPGKELEFLQIFSRDRVDGIILLGTVLTAEHRELLAHMEIPVVLVGQRLESCTSIYHEDREAARNLTAHILGRGRRNIGFIGVMAEDVAAGAERLAGYEEALKEAGEAVRPEFRITADFSQESGFSKMEELLGRAPSLDAVICATDNIAVGAMMHLKEAGKRIPEDLMLAGFGDNRVSRVTTPALTTVHYSYEESGELAASEILNMLSGNRTDPRQISLACSLVTRESA